MIGYIQSRSFRSSRPPSAKRRGDEPPSKKKSFWQSAAVSAAHCGSGCTLGDLAAERFIFFVQLTLFGRGDRRRQSRAGYSIVN
jgi:hypothetical protein